MNRQDLTTLLKQSSQTLADLLKAAELPQDLQDFNPEQVQLLEAIAQLVAQKKAKSFKEAVDIHHKSIREAQIQEVAARHEIAPERMPEILNALNFKLETITDTQVETFTQVCAQLQSGIALADAVPKPAKKKTPTSDLPEFAPKNADPTPDKTAITLANSNSLRTLEVTEAQQATLRDIALALAPEAVPNLAEEMVEAAEVVAHELKHTAQQIFFEAALEQLKTQNNDPQQAVELFRQRKRASAS
ncbi:MAG TPA: hypothetical protein V6D19_22395 [Stenomitos sp.]